MRVYFFILASIVVLIAGTWLHFKSRVNLDRFYEIEHAIKRICGLQNRLNEILIYTQRSLYPDYDALQKQRVKLGVAYDDLRVKLEQGYPKYPQYFSSQIKLLERLYSDREDLLIDSLEANSVARNSQVYIYSLIEKSEDQAFGIDSALRAEIIEYLASNTIDAHALLSKIELVELQTGNYDVQALEIINSLHDHIDVISKYRKRIAKLDESLAGMELLKVFDNISELNGQYLELTQDSTNQYQHRAYLATVIFYILFIITGFELRRVYRKQSRINNDLAASEKKLSSILDLVTGGLISVDEKQNILMINRRGEEIFGYKREELLGKNLSMLIPERFRTSHSSFIDEFSESGSAMLPHLERNRDLFGLKKSGQEFHIAAGISRLKLEDGVIYTAFIEDVSEQKERARELNRLRSLLGNVINSMPSVLLGVDSDGKVILWNRMAEHESGISQAEAIGQSIFYLYPRFPSNMRQIQSAIRGNINTTQQRVKSKKNGMDCYQEITVYPLEIDETQGVVIRIDDITQEVHIQEMVMQSEKMLSVGGLAAGMAHEINNPLAGILQNMQVIVNRLSPELEKNKSVAQECDVDLLKVNDYMDRRKILKMIDATIASGKRAADIIHNMLAFSRKGTGKKSDCSIVDLINKTLEVVENDFRVNERYDFKHIEIHKDFPDRVTNIACRPDQIQQVLFNILSNAAYVLLTGDGKNRQVSPRIIIRVTESDDWLIVEIEDNGPGMDEDIRKRIFEPFYTTKKEGVGVGLGLSVSTFIISENHGGMLSVDSVKGRGATFIIQLPIDSSAA